MRILSSVRSSLLMASSRGAESESESPGVVATSQESFRKSVRPRSRSGTLSGSRSRNSTTTTPRGPESESESPGVVATSQESKSESESVGSPESESEQRYHDSATVAASHLLRRSRLRTFVFSSQCFITAGILKYRVFLTVRMITTSVHCAKPSHCPKS